MVVPAMGDDWDAHTGACLHNLSVGSVGNILPLTLPTRLFILALGLLPFSTHQHLPLRLRLKYPFSNFNHLAQVKCRNPPTIKGTISVPMGSGSYNAHRTGAGCLPHISSLFCCRTVCINRSTWQPFWKCPDLCICA